jgi:hypothetical protein
MTPKKSTKRSGFFNGFTFLFEIVGAFWDFFGELL